MPGDTDLRRKKGERGGTFPRERENFRLEWGVERGRSGSWFVGWKWFFASPPPPPLDESFGEYRTKIRRAGRASYYCHSVISFFFFLSLSLFPSSLEWRAILLHLDRVDERYSRKPVSCIETTAFPFTRLYNNKSWGYPVGQPSIYFRETLRKSLRSLFHPFIPFVFV